MRRDALKQNERIVYIFATNANNGLSFQTMRQASQARLQLNSRIVPAMIGVLVVLQLVAPYRGWVILLVTLGATWLLGYLWARSLAQGLRLVREMRFGWAQVGDRLEERFTLINDSWLPALWVEVLDRSTLPDYNVSRATGVGSLSINLWRTQGVCTRRGIFTLGPTTLRSGDPFGLYTISVDDFASTTLVVMPPVVPLPTIEVAAGGRAGEGRRCASVSEPSVSTAGVREYLPGDSLRWIHWRTSARHDSLFVRRFDSTPAGDWWIFLDMEKRVQVGEAQNSTTEHAVILAASLAERGLRAGRAIGLVLYGAELVRLAPQLGDGQRWEILRALALANTGSLPLAELLARVRPSHRQPSSLIIITPSVNGEWIEALLPLLRGGAVPTILLLDPISFGGTADVRATRALLNELGMTHYAITRELLDRPELRAGKQGRWEWRVTGTGRAVPIRQPRDMIWKALS